MGLIAKSIQVDVIVGARPNFMKIAPILEAFSKRDAFLYRLIHTGQHYDVEMNAVFFAQLGIPNPDINLEIGSGSQTEQTAKMMTALESQFLAKRPDMILVVGDVNSTVSAALVAAKLHIPICHVEAGLRSFDKSMPEEVNRLVTDRLSDLLFTTERSANVQLEKEGVPSGYIHFVGNVMIDTLMANREQAVPVQQTLLKAGLDVQEAERVSKRYGMVTLHRPSNVDEEVTLTPILKALGKIAQTLPLVFTLHPRTRAKIKQFGIEHLLQASNIFPVNPLSYFEMLGANVDAAVVITDSGGLQEETTALGVPCLTFRENTERPITIDQGTNTLVGVSPETLIELIQEILETGGKRGTIPELWDGKSASRIVAVIEDAFDEGGVFHPQDNVL